LVNGGDIDSARVEKNSFKFTTDLPEPSLWVMLHTKDQLKFKELWLENSTMTFDSSESEFKDAEVTGSKNHSLSIELKEQLDANITEIPGDTLKRREELFIKQYPNALISAFIIYGNRRMSIADVRDLFGILSQEVQISSLGQRISKDLDKDIPEIGESYSDFSVQNSEGKIQNISELRGKLTLLQFWSSTCTMSRIMNSTLSKVYKNYHSKGFEIISVSNETDKDQWLNAIENDQLKWPQLSNFKGWKGEVFEAYGIHSTPSNLLINSGGKIVERNLDGDEIEEKIKKHLIK
jgi:peroxiredoxin